ncbi:AAA family ATPase [Variovorax sp. dw_308]|uniref:AAA family ATPase n=1 Tax=Variovorax sp. dw_308 TaxID=2721546 RepID=UPI001C480699|nr:AAA family ATPase [Variovorax sp. dw_308]
MADLKPSASPAGRGLQIDLLGGFRCALDGHPVAGMSYDKMRGLLAYLAMGHAQDHKRELLAELFWSGNDPVTARGNLRRTLSDLRRVLETPAGPALFSTSRSTIRFMLGHTSADQGGMTTTHRLESPRIDAVAFNDTGSPPGDDAAHQRDERLVALYRGEFMAGFYLADCPAFEDWLHVQRGVMHRRALALLEHLAGFHESAGNPGKALPFALRHVALEPWDEAAHRRAMRLHALLGQNGSALRQFDACARLLQDELGIAPGPETQALAERIRNDELAHAAAALPTAPQRPPTQTPTPTAPHAERRQVTVLFCELAISGVDDADDAMERMLAPRARCTEILRSFSGHVLPMHGGGLLAYFGYPQSREDSAVRAVRAALALVQEAIDGIKIRAGVHTGLILTDGDPSLPDAVGKTSAVAIQLRRLIGSGEAAISGEAHRIVAGYFDCTGLGSQVLPDTSQPIAIFRVDKESGARTRLDAATPLTPLVGRQAELAQLTQWWEETRHGANHAVLLQGEPAIGKSRLVHAFRQGLADEAHAVRVLRCFPEYSQSPFHPLLVLLAERMGFAAGDTPQLKSAKLAQHVSAAWPAWTADAVPLIAALFGLPPPADERAPAPVRPSQKEQTFRLLQAMLRGPTAHMGVLFIVEDLHWADPSTLELLAMLVAQGKGDGGLLSVFTARPEFAGPVATHALSLAPLAESEMTQLIASVSPQLSPEMVRGIAARADGVPLFAEELAKSATREDWAAIPIALHDLLAARMDRLGAARYAAQLAATIGREFSADLLRKVSPDEPEALSAHLDQLNHAGLVSRVDDTTFQFKHALVQEAAYQSQTRADRQAAHRRIAQVLQAELPDSVAARPELLAQHLSCAGDDAQAIEHWIRAGRRAISGSANLEAIAHFKRALQSLMTLPATSKRDQAEFSILVALCPALHATQGDGSEEIGRVTARISALHAQVADSPDLFLAEWTRLRNAVATIGPRGVPQAAMRLLEKVRDDPIARQAAHYAAAVATFWLGDFADSGAHSVEAIALYRPDQHHLMLQLFGEDLSVSLAGHLSWSLCFRGFPDQAQQVSARMLEQARAMAHPKTLAMALLFATMLRRWLNKHAETIRLAGETIALARQHGMLHWMATGEALQGKAQVLQDGHRDQHALTALTALAARLGAASPSYSALRMSDMAELHMHLNLHAEALRLLDQAQADELSTGSLQFAAERHRLRGLCLLALTPPDAAAAEAAFERALAISRAQGAKTLELRAAVCLARLWRQQGRHVQARQLLAETHGWFTEGFDTPDLVLAAGLLQDAASSAEQGGAPQTA